jgi:hypothetical protein
VARREEITPELLRILAETVDRAAQLDAEGDYMAVRSQNPIGTLNQ